MAEYDEYGGQLRQFVLVWATNDPDDPTPSISTAYEKGVSNVFDMADCYDGPDEGWTLSRDATHFVKVTTSGERRQINTEEEYPFRFAASDLVTEEGDVVGQVVWTDH